MSDPAKLVFANTVPAVSNSGLLHWTQSVDAFGRYPELMAIAYAVIVPESRLTAFAAQLRDDSPPLLGPEARLAVTPPGRRSFYCLVEAAGARGPQSSAAAGLDYCALTPLLMQVRDSGHSGYLPYELPGVTGVSGLVVETPVYSGRGVPATVAARRAAFLGWSASLVAPKFVLDQARRGHPDLALALTYKLGAYTQTYRDGTVPAHAQTATIDLHDGWSVTTYGPGAEAGIFGDGPAAAVFLSGLAVSVLLAALVLVLATGRARALNLVADRTRELRHQALHDALTGLPNRALIADRTERLLARNRRSGTLGAALFIDLDGFKTVNDTLGHEVGDRLLQSVAVRLTGARRDADTVGRLGGDEFVVLIDGVSDYRTLEMVAERLLDVMRQPFEIEGSTVPIVVTTSVGIAAGDRPTPGDLLRDADIALYQAKGLGKNCYASFHPEMDREIHRRQELENSLRSAVVDNEFRLVYQPIYTLDDLSLIGVEALVRWDHPSLGELQPTEFIPLLEGSQQIIDVGRWVLAEACRQMAAWRAKGSNLGVSVNISGRQLDTDAIIDHVRDALDQSGLEPAALTLEITETALMRNVEATAERLTRLKELGLQIAIDDFGTGYSSLGYLQSFPVDSLKIDRSFTNAIKRSPESDVLIHTLVQLGKGLGLKTLAEGVETPEQVDQLRCEEVNEIQGFLMAKPLRPAQFETELLHPGAPVGSLSSS